LINVFFKGRGNWVYFEDTPEDDPDQPYITYDVTYTANACGVFSLSPRDARTYRYTKSLAGVTSLYPCRHADSEFISRFGQEDDLSSLEEYYYFSIDDPDNPENILMIVEPAAEQHPAQTSSKESELSTTKALAIMAWLLSEKASTYNIAGRPNAKKINEAINALAIKAFPDDDQLSLSTFNKKISEAVKLFPLEELDGFNPKKK